MNGDNYPSGLRPGDSGIWCESLHVRSYDVDFSKRATAEAICRWFLEAAWNHAERLGFGFAALAQHNRFWVLARMLVRFEAYPKWGELVRLSTWPRGISGVFALRDFELANSAGSGLAAGTSSWLVLDSSSHRPQRIDKLLNIPEQVTRQAVGRDSQKLAEFYAETVSFTKKVRYSDIDVNSHVNSASYVNWLLDSYPAEFHRAHVLQSMELNYVGETTWSDEVSVLSHERSPLKFDHSIVNSQHSPVCRAEMDWSTRLTS